MLLMLSTDLNLLYLLGLAVQLVGLLIGCFLGSIEAKPKKPRSYTMIPSDVYDKTGVTLGKEATHVCNLE